MGFEVSGIDHECIWWATVYRQIAENLVENAHLGPTAATVVKSFVRTIDLWRVLPLLTGLQDVDDAGDHLAVIGACTLCGFGKYGDIFAIQASDNKDRSFMATLRWHHESETEPQCKSIGPEPRHVCRGSELRL